MAIRYGHTFDLAFTVYTDNPDSEAVALGHLLTAWAARLRYVDLESFGFVDTIEFDDPEEV